MERSDMISLPGSAIDVPVDVVDQQPQGLGFPTSVTSTTSASVTGNESVDGETTPLVEQSTTSQSAVETALVDTTEIDERDIDIGAPIDDQKRKRPLDPGPGYCYCCGTGNCGQCNVDGCGCCDCGGGDGTCCGEVSECCDEVCGEVCCSPLRCWAELCCGTAGQSVDGPALESSAGCFGECCAVCFMCGADA